MGHLRVLESNLIGHFCGLLIVCYSLIGVLQSIIKLADLSALGMVKTQDIKKKKGKKKMRWKIVVETGP